MSFSAIIQQDTLADALNAATAIVEECKLNTTPSGIQITAVDPANVAMVDLSINESAFESYEADGGTLGVNVERLLDVVGMGDSGDLVQLELDQETRKLNIEISGLSYTLALIDPDSIRQEPDIPDLDLDATLVFEAATLSRGISAADLCSDHVSFAADPDAETFHIKADGDTDDVDLEVDSDELLSAQVDDDCESLFSLDYLSDMERPIGSDTEVSLRLGSEMPIKLRYSLADGDVSVTNMLAPRISSE
mgnify:CR=1 FL=1